MNSEVVAVLNRAAELVERGWVQCVSALDWDGRAVSPLDPAAVCFCLSGAVTRATCDVARGSFGVELNAREVIAKTLPPPYRRLPGFNDASGRTKADVIAVLRLAVTCVTP